jgi:hypothetical protein
VGIGALGIERDCLVEEGEGGADVAGGVDDLRLLVAVRA